MDVKEITLSVYIYNVLGQKLENSESCICLRLLKEAKFCNLPKIAMFEQLNYQLLVGSK